MPDPLDAVRAEGRRLLAETTKGPWHQMAAAAWSGTNEDPNLVADCPLYADAIAIVWLRNHADALLADPTPEGLSEEERVVMVMALEDYMELCVEQSDDYRHEFRHDEARILGERGATAEALIDRLTPTEAATDG